MLERINDEINLCFQCIKYEADGGETKETCSYKAASILLKAYNALVKVYYLPEYQKDFLKGSISQEYKLYKESVEFN